MKDSYLLLEESEIVILHSKSQLLLPKTEIVISSKIKMLSRK